MNTMEGFIAATEPVLREMLQGTGIEATYAHTAEGGEVRLRLALYSCLSFADGEDAHFEEKKAEEAKALVRCFQELLAEASKGVYRLAPEKPEIYVAWC